MINNINLCSFKDENLNTIQINENNLDKHQSVQWKVELYQWIQTHIWLFPLMTVVLIPFLSVVIYLASVYYGHVESLFPYISDTGSTKPEAGYFSMLIDLVVITNFIAGYARYKQIKYYLAHFHENKSNTEVVNSDVVTKLKRNNFVSWAILSGSMIGFVIIGNFRSTENVWNHMIGVFFAFSGFFIYQYFMIVICTQLWKKFSIETKPLSMTIFLAFTLFSTVLTGAFGYLSLIEFGSAFSIPESRLHWDHDKLGYLWHVLSCTFEWVTINSCSLFVLCLYRRMKLFKHWNQAFQ